MNFGVYAVYGMCMLNTVVCTAMTELQHCEGPYQNQCIQ